MKTFNEFLVEYAKDHNYQPKRNIYYCEGFVQVFIGDEKQKIINVSKTLNVPDFNHAFAEFRKLCIDEVWRHIYNGMITNDGRKSTFIGWSVKITDSYGETRSKGGTL